MVEPWQWPADSGLKQLSATAMLAPVATVRSLLMRARSLRDADSTPVMTVVAVFATTANPALARRERFLPVW